MIAKISALINKRLSDLGLEDQSTNQIIKNSKLSFSDNLDKGHLTTNIAMVGAGVAKKNPKEIAEFIKKSLLEDQSINKIEIAGPGFINIFLEQEIFLDLLCECVQFSNQVPEKDKQKIVRWIVKVYSDHPSLSDISKISSNKKLMVDKEIGEVFTSLLAEKCRDKAIKAIELEGDMVLYTAFKTLGEVAGQQLLNDENVQNSLNEFTKYVDYEKLDYIND